MLVRLLPAGFVLLALAAFATLLVSSECPQSLIGSACTRSAKLGELFPSLAHLSEAEALTITVRWSGLSEIPYVNVQYALQRRGNRFEGVARGLVERRGGRGSANAVRQIAIPSDSIRSFLAASNHVLLTEGEYKPRITYTDDYPLVRVDVECIGVRLRIETRSQRGYPGLIANQLQSAQSNPALERYPDRTPWAINYLGRTFIITANDLDKAWDRLLDQLEYEDIERDAISRLPPRRSNPE